MGRKPRTSLAAQQKAGPRTLDDLTIVEFDALVDKSRMLFAQGRNMWPEMRGLSSAQRLKSKGKTAFLMGEIFTKLFATLMPPAALSAKQEAALTAEEKQHRTTKQKLLNLFHSALGAQDQGNDPGKFEVELLQRRLHRALRQKELAEELRAFARLLADDALVAGEKVQAPGLRALRLARTIAENNPAFGTLLFPALDLAAKMTLAARKAKAEKAAKAQKKKGKEPPDGNRSGKK